VIFTELQSSQLSALSKGRQRKSNLGFC